MDSHHPTAWSCCTLYTPSVCISTHDCKHVLRKHPATHCGYSAARSAGALPTSDDSVSLSRHSGSTNTGHGGSAEPMCSGNTMVAVSRQRVRGLTTRSSGGGDSAAARAVTCAVCSLPSCASRVSYLGGTHVDVVLSADGCDQHAHACAWCWASDVLMQA